MITRTDEECAKPLLMVASNTQHYMHGVDCGHANTEDTQLFIYAHTGATVPLSLCGHTSTHSTP